jgi:hypothetical protein
MTSGLQDGMTGRCWLHPQVRVRVSAIEGRGLYAAQPLMAGTVIATLAGRLPGLAQPSPGAQLTGRAPASYRPRTGRLATEALSSGPPAREVGIWRLER